MWFCDEIASAGDDFIYNLCWRPTVASIAGFPFVSLVWPTRTAYGKNSVHFQFQKTSVYFSILRTADISKNQVDEFSPSGKNYLPRPCRAVAVVILEIINLFTIEQFAIGGVQSDKSWICVFRINSENLALEWLGWQYILW